MLLSPYFSLQIIQNILYFIYILCMPTILIVYYHRIHFPEVSTLIFNDESSSEFVSLRIITYIIEVDD